jgi:hypothetical protein
MSVITIPFDYEHRKDRDVLVPICISDTDGDGRKVAWGWIEAVVPIADRARSLAKRILEDEWRVSELMEGSVHSLARKHGENYGVYPQFRLLGHAKWRALDLKYGHWRVRKGYEVPLGDLEYTLREKSSHADEYQKHEILDVVRQDLIKLGYDDASEVMDMILHGCRWEEVADSMGIEVTDRSVNTLQRWFWRVFEKVTQGR